MYGRAIRSNIVAPAFRAALIAGFLWVHAGARAGDFIRRAGDHFETSAGATFNPVGAVYYHYAEASVPVEQPEYGYFDYGPDPLTYALSTLDPASNAYGLPGFDPIRMNADFQQLSLRGFNMVRLLAGSWCNSKFEKSRYPDDFPNGLLSKTYLDNLKTAVDLARANHLYVLLDFGYLPDTYAIPAKRELCPPGDVEHWVSGFNAYLMSGKMVRLYNAYLLDMLSELASRGADADAIMGIELFDEPRFMRNEIALEDGKRINKFNNAYPWCRDSGVFQFPGEAMQYRMDSQIDRIDLVEESTRRWIDGITASLKTAPWDHLLLGFTTASPEGMNFFGLNTPDPSQYYLDGVGWNKNPFELFLLGEPLSPYYALTNDNLDFIGLNTYASSPDLNFSFDLSRAFAAWGLKRDPSGKPILVSPLNLHTGHPDDGIPVDKPLIFCEFNAAESYPEALGRPSFNSVAVASNENIKNRADSYWNYGADGWFQFPYGDNFKSSTNPPVTLETGNPIYGLADANSYMLTNLRPQSIGAFAGVALTREAAGASAGANASNAVDDDPKTAWTATGSSGAEDWIFIQLPSLSYRSVSGIQIDCHTGKPAHVRVIPVGCDYTDLWVRNPPTIYDRDIPDDSNGILNIPMTDALKSVAGVYVIGRRGDGQSAFDIDEVKLFGGRQLFEAPEITAHATPSGINPGIPGAATDGTPATQWAYNIGTRKGLKIDLRGIYFVLGSLDFDWIAHGGGYSVWTSLDDVNYKLAADRSNVPLNKLQFRDVLATQTPCRFIKIYPSELNAANLPFGLNRIGINNRQDQSLIAPAFRASSSLANSSPEAAIDGDPSGSFWDGRSGENLVIDMQTIRSIDQIEIQWKQYDGVYKLYATTDDPAGTPDWTLLEERMTMQIAGVQRHTFDSAKRIRAIRIETGDRQSSGKLFRIADVRLCSMVPASGFPTIWNAAKLAAPGGGSLPPSGLLKDLSASSPWTTTTDPFGLTLRLDTFYDIDRIGLNPASRSAGYRIYGSIDGQHYRPLMDLTSGELGNASFVWKKMLNKTTVRWLKVYPIAFLGDGGSFGINDLRLCGWPLNGAQFVSQILPPSVQAGHEATVWVSFKNTGQSVWTEPNAYFRLGSQSPQDNVAWGIGRMLLNNDEVVGQDQTATYRGNIRAHWVPQTNPFQWRMVQEFVGWFGEISPAANIEVTP